MQVLALAMLLAATGDFHFRIETSHGTIQVVRGAETAAGTTGADTLKKGDRLILAADASISISDSASRAVLSGPGELEVNPTQLRWRGSKIIVAAGERPLQLVLESGMLQLGNGEVRVRSDTRATYVETLQGSKVVYIGPAGYVEVPAQKGLRIDGKGIQPEVLLSAPIPLYPAPHESLRAFRFWWRPVKDAVGYQIEVAKDPLFTELLYAGEISGSVYAEKARALPIGLLFWRVTAKGRNGFWGLSSEPQPARVAP